MGLGGVSVLRGCVGIKRWRKSWPIARYSTSHPVSTQRRESHFASGSVRAFSDCGLVRAPVFLRGAITRTFGRAPTYSNMKVSREPFGQGGARALRRCVV